MPRARSPRPRRTRGRLRRLLISAVVVTSFGALLQTVAGGPAAAHVAPSVPTAASSRYIKTTDPQALSAMGCRLGKAVVAHAAPRDGIVILDFGRPTYHRHHFGTSLFGEGWPSTTRIGEAVRAYAGGFWTCTRAVDGVHLRIGIGTSNYGTQVSFGHGRAWAEMVNDTNRWLASKGYLSRVDVAGASDIELSWNSPGVSRNWVRGYDSVAEWPYYDYGDASSCPPRGVCAGAWTQEDVWYVAWGARSAWPLPEIYTPTGSQAAEWQQLSLYSFLHHGSRMHFAGAISQWTACHQSNDSCWGMDNSPRTAWRQLWSALNADRRTAQDLRWSTDLRWDD